MYDISAEWLELGEAGLDDGGRGIKNLDHQHSNSTTASETSSAHWHIRLGWSQFSSVAYRVRLFATP